MTRQELQEEFCLLEPTVAPSIRRWRTRNCQFCIARSVRTRPAASKA
jgi:hypothetical protein